MSKVFIFLFVPSLSSATIYQSLITSKDGIFTSSFWGFRIELSGYEESSTLETGSVKQLLALEKKAVGEAGSRGTTLLTMFAEEFNEVVSPKSCFKKIAEQKLKQQGVKDIKSGEKPFNYYFYDAPLPREVPQEQKNVISRHGYGYWARDYQCFEIHMSATFHPSKAVKEAVDQEMVKTMRSFELSPRAPGLLRAVILNRTTKPSRSPQDPAGYIVLGGTYLHDEAAKNPIKALLYYQGALDLGAKDKFSLWTIYEGMGWAYHGLKNYKEAVAYYQKAVAVIEGGSQAGLKMPTTNPDGLLRESYYNLGCVYSLLGDLENSKKSIEKVFKVIAEDNKAVQNNFDKIHSDSDFNNLRKSPGFSSWLSRLVVGG